MTSEDTSWSSKVMKSNLNVAAPRLTSSPQNQLLILRRHATFDANLRSPVLSTLQNFEASWVFNSACSLVIVFNAVLLAIDAEYAARNLEEPNHIVLSAFELLLSAHYTCELLLRILVHRLGFFKGADKMWNAFDSLLVVLAIYDIVDEWALRTDGGSMANHTYLRVTRLGKMLKLLRVFRVMRAFRELRLVLNTVLGSLKSIVWSCLLASTIAFMFGVMFVQGVTGALQDELTRDGGRSMIMASIEEYEALRRPTAPEIDAMIKYWGSVPRAMLSLFRSATGGDDWAITADPLWQAGSHFYFFFVFFIGFWIIVVVNSITALFVDGALTESEKDDQTMIQEQLRKKSAYVSKIVQLFQLIDHDASGCISNKEFLDHMSDPHMLAFAESLSLEVTDLEQLFDIFSCGGKQTVDVENFVVGCIKLRGTARSLDLLDLSMQTSRLAQEQWFFREFCAEQFKEIRAATSRAARRDLLDLSMQTSRRAPEPPTPAVCTATDDSQRQEGLVVLEPRPVTRRQDDSLPYAASGPSAGAPLAL